MNRRICNFLMNHMANDDTDFYSKLPKHFHKTYKDQKASIIKDNDAKWPNKQHFDKRRDGIEQDANHNKILSACIFPFVQQNNITQKLDYVYIRSSPLSERGVKNVDFLIASKTDRILIFGEAKGTITDPRTTITEYKERIKTINENSVYIQNMFPDIKLWEYVLGVPSDRAVETSKTITRSNTNIILWQVGIWDGDKLSIVVPDTDTATRQKMMHKNNALNKALGHEGVQTSTSFKTFYHESHPVAKMTVLTSIDKKSEHFTFTDLQTCVSEELDNTSDSEITTIAEKIIRLAIDIGFVKQLDGETYKIQSIYKNSRARYHELKNKWIRRKIELDKKDDLNLKLKILQDELLAKHTSLDNYQI